MTGRGSSFPKDRMYRKFQLYGFLKNLRFFDPFLILFFREMGLSFLEIGALYSIREIVTNLLEIPTGILADAYGRRKAMVASFAAYIVSFLIFYLVPGFWSYVLAMALFALGETFRSGTHKAMILEYLRIRGIEEQKVAYYGHTRAASQLGSALAALLAAGLVFYTGSFRIIFLASAVPYVLGLVLLVSYPRELDGDLVRIEGGWLCQALGRLRSSARDLGQLLRHPPLLRALASSAAFDAVFKSTKDYLQPILQAQALALPVLLAFQDDQRTAAVVGVLYFVIYLGTSFASSRAGTLCRHADALATAVNGTYVAGGVLLASAGIAAWGGIPGIAIAAFLSVYLIQNLRRPIIVGYVAELISHRAMATGLSLEVQLRTVLMAGLAPMLGFLADRLGVGLAVLSAACVAAALFPLLVVRSSSTSQT